MWGDYPDEVKAYRVKQKLRTKFWKDPTVETIESIVRIFTMSGSIDDGTATFCTLWNNGFKIKDSTLKEVREDAGLLLDEWLAS